MKLETMTPSEIDQELANLYGARATVVRTLNYNRAIVANERGRYSIHDIKRAQEQLPKIEARLAEATEAIAPFEEEFTRRGGWKRYFLVQNTGGHIHRERRCQTCFSTTAYAWLTDLSDCDETEMVAQYGETACTVCFPDAPAMKGWGEYAKRIKSDRAAVKAAKQAEKDAKAVFNTEGKRLYKTDRAGEIELVQALAGAIEDTQQAEEDEERRERFLERAEKAKAHALDIADAFALKRGTTVEDEIEAVTDRVWKKVKRDAREAAKAAARFAEYQKAIHGEG